MAETKAASGRILSLKQNKEIKHQILFATTKVRNLVYRNLQ
jgi:hypothetical protein